MIGLYGAEILVLGKAANVGAILATTTMFANAAQRQNLCAIKTNY